MKRLITLKKIRVENANAIAGFTYGFPAISQFLGFTHALSRKIKPQYGVELKGCAVVCHAYQIKSQRQSIWGDSVFSLSRNPITREGKTAPFNEEGKMHMEVSLLIECVGDLLPRKAMELTDYLIDTLPTLRLAGGIITTSISEDHFSIEAFPEETREHRRKLFSLLPGFVLMDRSEKVQIHFDRLHKRNPDIEFLDAWLDFCTLKFSPQIKSDGEEAVEGETNVDWQIQPKPESGWLVPITTGYKAISPVYQPGEVANARDEGTPFRFVEAAYGVGEWTSPHRIQDIEDTLWRYHYEGDWYLCQQHTSEEN